jgi:hypothetical protein
MPQAAIAQWLALLNRVEAEQAGRWPVEDQARISLARGCLCRAQKQDAGLSFFFFLVVFSLGLCVPFLGFGALYLEDLAYILQDCYSLCIDARELNRIYCFFPRVLYLGFGVHIARLCFIMYRY